MKLVKKLDIVIIIALLVLSFTPYLMLKGYTVDETNENLYAVISVGGKVVEKIELLPEKEEEYVLTTPYGENKIHIHEGKIGISEADCADGVCVAQGYIDKPGEQVVCLPHKLIITIEGKQIEDKGEDIISR